MKIPIAGITEEFILWIRNVIDFNIENMLPTPEYMFLAAYCIPIHPYLKHKDVSLCKCGIDMKFHQETNSRHQFIAAGTMNRCGAMIYTSDGLAMCPRPMYHIEDGVPCGPLTGDILSS